MREQNQIDEIFGVLQQGYELAFRKTVSETDVYLFAGVTGDFHPNHVDEPFMQATEFGQRMAHGALIVGFMSTASAQVLQHSGKHALTLGYDRIRFIKPVFFGDTVQVVYKATSFDAEKRRMRADVTVHNQNDELVAVATHVAYFAPGIAG